LAELERSANCQIDIADELFRYLHGDLYHPRPPRQVSRAI
jgi:hypothetical protein